LLCKRRRRQLLSAETELNLSRMKTPLSFFSASREQALYVTTKMNNKLNTSKIVKNILAILIFFAVIYFGIIPFIFGGKKIKTFCRQIIPGMKSNEVYKLIDRTHYKFLENKKGDNHTITIIDSKAMGRFICEVSLDHGKVIEARYVYND